MFSSALLLAALPLASAHFLLNWPPARGFDDDKAGTFPCGGFDTVQSNRTAFPLSGGPIQLDMHHTQTKIEVLLSLGNDPGSNYNIVLRPTLAQQGLGNFCMGDVMLPSSANVTAGMNGTIQEVSNGDPDGGLYQCADVTFTSASLDGNHCANGTGSTVTQQNIAGNPNGTTTSTSASASASAKTGAAASVYASSWLLGAVGVAGLALL